MEFSNEIVCSVVVALGAAITALWYDSRRSHQLCEKNTESLSREIQKVRERHENELSAKFSEAIVAIRDQSSSNRELSKSIEKIFIRLGDTPPNGSPIQKG